MFYSGRAYQGAQGHIYPYPLLDSLTDIREKKTYNSVFLENKYIKICVLPEIGGRILSAVDKTNNYDFIYQQHVIKPALIGMLGAWISGGVEWNFPHHHRPTTFMPVDYTLRENPDGSKTIWIGEIELRHRMKWVIGLTLYPGKSYIETTVKLFNRTPFAHSFLYWANVAVHATPAYQVIFPPSTEYATFHGKNQFSHWPISYEVFNAVDYTKGVDVSWWKNHPSPTSFFAWNYEDDFMTGYDHEKQAGTVHVANHHIVPGKKFFEWGNCPEGRMWDKILTETDGPYVELMFGAYSDNQPDYSWLQPYEVKIIKQYWYPIQRIGGVKKANCEAAVSLELTSENTAKIGFNTTSKYERAIVLVKAGEKVIFEQTTFISPEKPFVKEITIPSKVREEDIQVCLLSSTNQELIAYRPAKKEKTQMPKPVEPPPPPKDIKTIEELYLTGLRLEQFHNPVLDPYPYYEEALRRDPGDYRVNTALGVLYCKRGLFKEAEERFNLALERATRNHTTPKDGEAYYYLGVSLKAQEKHDAAYDAFFKATWYHTFHAAAYYSLAELECLKGDFPKAVGFIDRSICTNTLNTKAINLKTAVLRKLGRFEAAEKLASRVLSTDPLDFYAGNELYLARSKMELKKEPIEQLENLKEKMRGNVQSYLEVAVDYGNLGLWDEAIEVLSRLVDSNKKEVTTYPMVHYYLGYFLEKKGEAKEAHRYYQLGSKMPTDYCFPFRLKSINVLRSAVKNNPRDAHAPYYLGNLLYYFEQPEKAIKEWEKSRSLDDTFSIVHRNLGLAYARAGALTDNDLSEAIACLEKAVACNRKDPILYYELDQLYEVAGVSPKKRLELLEKNHETILNRGDALSREIALYVQLGQYDRAIDLLNSHHFHVWEGGGQIHNVYVDAYLLRGLEKFKAEKYLEALKDYEAALDYPENLEVGKPYHGGRASQICYFIGTAYEALGDTEKAGMFYEKSVASKRGWSEIWYYQGLAYRKLGQEEEAKRMFDGLIDVGTERLKASSSMDYFAKFAEKQSRKMRMADAYYLQGLGYLGKDEKEEAKVKFEKALQLNINHFGARRQLSELK
jgi:tetratricopeptide (TPR) repeat protein